jgi:hypothetical protein
VNKIDEPLAKVTKRIQINEIRNENGYVTTNSSDIQKIMMEYFENLYSNKLENLEEMDKFLNTLDYQNEPGGCNPSLSLQ